MEKQDRSVSLTQRIPSDDYSSLSTTNMVPTIGGTVHYVKKQVGFGGKGVVEMETANPTNRTDDEVFAAAATNADSQKSSQRSSFKKSKLRKSLRRSGSEGNLALQGIGTGDGQQGLCHTLPPRGELRHVYLDMSWTRFGFRLQSYGRRSEEKKTIVQAVTPGSPAFMAGLHPGDCILEVNGQDMTSVSVNDVLTAILNTSDKRVQLLVQFTDGAHRIELKKKLQMAQESLKEKQKSLKQLLATKQCLTSYSGPVTGWVNDDCPKIEFLFIETELSSHLSSDDCLIQRPNYSNLAVYTSDIQYINCDAVVVPFDTVNPIDSSPVMTFLRAGGDKMMNEISLADQCCLGDVMTTTGGELKCISGQVYHCVFRHFEQLKLCFRSALNKCLSKDLLTVAFWLDGFIYCHVPPTILVETIKDTLLEPPDDHLLDNFKVVIFASQVLPQLAELVTHIYKHDDAS